MLSLKNWLGRRTLESRAAEHRGCEGGVGNVWGMSMGGGKEAGPSRRRASEEEV